MASTYTPNLGLTKQANGENSGTWGTIVNTVFDMVEDAIAGRLSKSVAGSSDVALTDSDGAVDEHRNMMMELTGTLTGNINVTVPPSAKLYFIHNNTSGSYTLTFKTTAGTGIAITQGKKEILMCDGTNIVRAFDNLTITGGSITGITDLAVADGGTGASTAADARTNLGAETAGNSAALSIALGG